MRLRSKLRGGCFCIVQRDKVGQQAIGPKYASLKYAFHGQIQKTQGCRLAAGEISVRARLPDRSMGAETIWFHVVWNKACTAAGPRKSDGNVQDAIEPLDEV